VEDTKQPAIDFGGRLREVRETNGDSLREVARRSGLNSGYLSQLENGKIIHPSPSILEKLAKGYGLRFEDILRWAGYVREPDEEITPNQAVALSTVSGLGDPSDEEVRTLKAIVELLQSKRAATFAAASDRPLETEAVAEIRGYALAVLREADGLGRRPTPLEDVQKAARLVLAGEITLDAKDRARLFERFGKWVHLAWKRLQGTFDYRASAIWVNPDLHAMKRRFVVSHEIGHAILPAHKQTFAYVDDFTRFPPFVRDLFEREANQAAVEILFQGGQATDEFDSSPPSLDEICQISAAFGASIVSTARYAVETSERAVAVAIAHRNGNGGLGPTHIYRSRRFETAFGWRGGAAPWAEIRTALRTAHSGDDETWVVENLRREPRVINTQKMNTGYAAIVLSVPESRARSIKRRLAPGMRGAVLLPK
jgi:transcriptional regulator with XRE-family HTH domain/Zn-dependent peptidase ImmA (M78 family)